MAFYVSHRYGGDDRVVTDDIALDLVETSRFGLRVIYERYRRARDESE